MAYSTNIVLTADTSDVVDGQSYDYKRGLRQLSAWHETCRKRREQRLKEERKRMASAKRAINKEVR